MKDVYVVIMAGGSGERFWPRSRQKLPKQFLSIVSEKSMLDETIDRIKGVVPDDRIYIVVNKRHVPLVKKYKNVIQEPISRNTAPCIALSARIIQKKDPGGIMVVLPADHYIKDVHKFRDTIEMAINVAQKEDVLVTLGITPISPHTGYGYIKKGKKLSSGVYKISKFTEKPDLKTAKRYLASGNYLWNSGIFIWKIKTILEEIDKYLPNILEGTEKISIDYGVMEKTKRAVVIESKFGWDDVGNWASLDRYFKKDKDGNIFQGEVVCKDVKDSTIISEGALVAGIGVSGLVIVATKDALLLCPKERAEEVKDIVGILKERNDYGRI